MDDINSNSQGQWGRAGSGAMKGASMGAVAGPWGALVGGLAGGAYGLLSGPDSSQGNDAQHRQMLMDYYAQIQARQAPQAGAAAQSGYSGFRSNQSELISRLEAMSKGQGPSLAAQQFQQATDRNMAGQQSMAQSGRGGQLAAFNAANNMGQLGAQAAQGSAMARTQEQQMALQALGQNINAGRGADENTNQFNTGQTNNHALANLDARLKAMGLDDNARLEILRQMDGQQSRISGQATENQALLAGAASGYAQYASTQKQAPPQQAQQPQFGTREYALAQQQQVG